MLKKLFMSCLLICVTFISSASTVNMIVTHPSKFVIDIPSNPTTGYQVTLVKYDKKLLRLVKQYYYSAHSQLIGAGGKMRFTFARISSKPWPRQTTLEFKRARPWENNDGQFITVVNVKFSKNFGE